MPDEPDLSDAIYTGEPAAEPPEPDGLFTDAVGTDEPTEPQERQPKTARVKRSSASMLITMLWGAAGTALVKTGADVPVGRVLQFQAPLAGSKVDELIANTWVDNLLQPFVAQADKFEALGALITFPLLIGAYERNPAIETVVEPILREVITQTLVDMAPVLKAKQAKARRAAVSLTDLGKLLELEKGQDPVDAVLASLFAPIEATATEVDPNAAPE